MFVFAFTQVTSLLVDDPTWGGVFRGMLVLAAVWWAWSVYAWLTSAMDVDEGGVRLLMPIACLFVRLFHLVLSPIVAALALVSSVCSLVAAYEAIRHREHRVLVRHPELAE